MSHINISMIYEMNGSSTSESESLKFYHTALTEIIIVTKYYCHFYLEGGKSHQRMETLRYGTDVIRLNLNEY